MCVCFFLIYIYLFSLFLFSSSNVSNFYFSVQWWKIYTSEGSHCPQWTQYTSYSQPKRSNIVFFVTVNSDFLSSNTNSVKLSLSFSLCVFCWWRVLFFLKFILFWVILHYSRLWFCHKFELLKVSPCSSVWSLPHRELELLRSLIVSGDKIWKQVERVRIMFAHKLQLVPWLVASQKSQILE